MSSPEKQTDETIEQILSGQIGSGDDADMLQILVDTYQAESLSPELKQQLWKKAQLMIEKPKRQAKRKPWYGRLVAALVLLIGIFAAYAYIVPSLSTTTDELSDAQLDSMFAYRNTTLFANP